MSTTTGREPGEGHGGTLEKFQHFVSRMQLARFADARGRVHVWNPHAGRVLPQSPARTFGQTHLYSTEDDTGAKDTWFEKRLAKLEGEAEPLLRRIEQEAARDRAPVLDSGEKATLDRFFYTQWKRVPDFFGTSEWMSAGEGVMDASLDALRTRLPNRIADIDAQDTPENRRRLLRTGRMLGLAQDSERVLGLFDRRGLVVMRLPEGGPGFVIGSLPIVRTAASLEQEGGEAWLPIGPRLLIGPGMARGTMTLAKFDPAELTPFNRVVANQSTTFGGPDPAQVEELAAWVAAHRGGGR